MRLLLDTHALIWFTGDPDVLRPDAREAIVSADTVVVSAASIWEISTKAALGKLTPPVDASSTSSASGASSSLR